MTTMVRLSLLFVTMIGCVGCDQVTKVAARTYLGDGAVLSFVHDTMRLQHAENPGAFLSMGDGLPAGARTMIFTLGGTVLVGGALLWAIRARQLNAVQTVGAALICSGGIGNLIDRILRHGYVTDFLNVGIGPLRTGIFNIADVALLLGVAIIFMSGSGARRTSLPTS
jgi:signal peptidase II